MTTERTEMDALLQNQAVRAMHGEVATIPSPAPQNILFDWVKGQLQFVRDSQLARAMDISTSTLSSIRTDKNKFGPSYQLKILKLTNITYSQMKEIMGCKNLVK